MDQDPYRRTTQQLSNDSCEPMTRSRPTIGLRLGVFDGDLNIQIILLIL